VHGRNSIASTPPPLGAPRAPGPVWEGGNRAHELHRGSDMYPLKRCACSAPQVHGKRTASTATGAPPPLGVSPRPHRLVHAAADVEAAPGGEVAQQGVEGEDAVLDRLSTGAGHKGVKVDARPNAVCHPGCLAGTLCHMTE